jgi:hypothetical protein
MASIQKFESIKGNIFYVTMFDGETVTLPHQNIQNNTIALIRGNGVVALSSGEITIHGSASFLFYNNKWNYVTPEVTRERLDGEVEKLNQAIETLSEELGSEIDRIDGEITEIQGDLEELNPLKPQEYVLQIVPETGLEMISYQAYRVGKVVFIFVLAQNNTNNVITIDANENMFQLVGAKLKIGFGRLDVTISTTTLTATGTNFIGPTNTFNTQPKASTVIYGFLFTD